MKLKTHFLVFTILFIINFAILYVVNQEKPIPEKVKFKSVEKEEALVIKNNVASGTTKVEINFNNTKYNLKAKVNQDKKEKLKYKLQIDELNDIEDKEDKTLIVSVKYSSDGDFKILNHEDKLLYKIKIYSNKIKIGTNEECNPYYEIKETKGKVKVYDLKGINIGSVKFNDGKLKVKRVIQNNENKEDLYSTKDLDYKSYSIGVMSISEIAPISRAVIAAELIKKGK